MTFELMETDRKVDHIKSTLERILGISDVTVQSLPTPSSTINSADHFKTALNYFGVSELKRNASLALYFDVSIPAYRNRSERMQLRVQLLPSQEGDFKIKYGEEYRLMGW